LISCKALLLINSNYVNINDPDHFYGEDLVRTLWDYFTATCAAYPQGKFLGSRGPLEEEFKWLTFKEGETQVDMFTIGMQDINYRSEQQAQLDGVRKVSPMCPE